MDKWEYKIIKFTSPSLVTPGRNFSIENEEEILNKLGEDGWEVTGVIWPDGGAKVYLKRRKN